MSDFKGDDFNGDDFHSKTQHLNKLFNLIKSNKEKEFMDYINQLTPDQIDINIRDENGNYMIFFAIIMNSSTILKKLIKYGARLDVFDTEGNSVMYYPIKFGYYEIIDILIDYDSKIIGISLINIKDHKGSVPLFYAIKYRNKYALQQLLSKDANANYRNNDNVNALHMAVLKKDISMVKLVIKHIKNLNSRTRQGSTALHYACNFQLYDITKLLLDNGADQNIIELELDFYPIFYSVIQNDINISKLLVDYGANPNHQDYEGNTILHYCVIYNHMEIFDYIMNNYVVRCRSSDLYIEDINSKVDIPRDHIDPNVVNLDGLTVVHLMLYDYKEEYDNFLKKLIPYCNLNYQDNTGNTILHLIAENNIWNKFDNLLNVKKLNIFIRNNNGKTVLDMIQVRYREIFIDTIVKSYYNYLNKYDNGWLLQWQNECSGSNLSEISEKKCLELIRNDVVNNKISLPTKKNKKSITIINDEIVHFSTFTGSLIDTVSGFKYLTKKYPNATSLIIDNQEITNDLQNYYQSIGIQINISQNIVQFEIKWIYQKIFMPIEFENTMQQIILSNKYKYIIFPISIILSSGNHSNGLFYDLEKQVIERFEPHGSDYPNKFNYNPDLLDDILEKKFKIIMSSIYHKNINIRYLRPRDYLPKIGFQTIENTEININKNIGDPNGFCTLWTIWYLDYRLSYADYDPSKLTRNLINEIRINNYSFRTIIRNYSKKITDLRDYYLNKINRNINDYLNNRLTTNNTRDILRIIVDDSSTVI